MKTNRLEEEGRIIEGWGVVTAAEPDFLIPLAARSSSV